MSALFNYARDSLTSAGHAVAETLVVPFLQPRTESAGLRSLIRRHPTGWHSWVMVSPSSFSTSPGHPATMHSSLEVPSPTKSCFKISGSNSLPAKGRKKVQFGRVGEIFEVPDGFSQHKTPERSVMEIKWALWAERGRIFDKKRVFRKARRLRKTARKNPDLFGRSSRRIRHRSMLDPSMRKENLRHRFRTPTVRPLPPTSPRCTSESPSWPKPIEQESEAQLALVTSKMQSLSIISGPPSRLSGVFKSVIAPLSMGLLTLGFWHPGCWDVLGLALVGYMAVQK